MSKVLIVGGGVAGLSAGIYARLHGFDAVVCEAHAVAGGCLTSWERGGCHIDNCIHWLTGTNPEAADGLYAVWKDLGMLGEGVELRRRPYLYQVEADGKTVEFHRDLREMERQMLEASPEDEKETHGFIRAVDAVMRLLGIAEDGHRLSGSLLTGTPVLARYWNLSVGELAERFSHPALRQIGRAHV